MTISVRAAQRSDAARIAQLTFQLGYEVSASTVEARLLRILERPDHQFVVAELDGHAVGWVHVVLISEYIEAEPFVVIGGLVVDSAQRRKGIGRILMMHAERWAEKEGCSVVRLWSSISRTAAHRFYEELGYRNLKTQYSFVKVIGGQADEILRGLVPRVDA